MDVESQNSDTVYSQHLGLHHYCNTALPDKPCRTFPDEEKDCDPNDRYFCSMWRTTGFLMSFATVAELATLVCFVVAIGGGSVKREYGWKVLCGLLTVVSVVQFAAMGLIVSFPLLSRDSIKFVLGKFTLDKAFWFTDSGLQSFLYDNDEYFSVPGWRLDTSWILCTVSASVAAILVGALASCAYFLPPEDDGYNFLDDPIDV